MDQKRILVVEDDSAIRQGVVDALQFAGYETLQAPNGNDGMTQSLRGTFDLLLLDLILPGHSGFEILKAARETRPTLPVIILTARGEEADRVQGLRLGADDYVVKPFSVRELLARVEAVLRPVRGKGYLPASLDSCPTAPPLVSRLLFRGSRAALPAGLAWVSWTALR